MIGRNNPSAKFAEDFRQHFQRIIMHPGKARELSSTVFKERVVNAGGVRFFAKYEQICQMASQGVETIMTKILPICKEKQWLE